jgi:LysR family transcriptional regulator, flagellar master operon regulator
MDVDLARTFLAIAETAHFGKAARVLNVTQSTISTRIKTLEDLLGQQLFIRSKLGTTLTPAGIKFKSSAETMIRVWEHARQQVSLASEFQSLITVGGELTLWQQIVLKWLPWVRSSLPDVAVRTEIMEPESLAHHLVEGSMEIGLTYLPINRPGIETEILMDEELVLISAGAGDIEPGQPSYVYVDWGTTFGLQHEASFAGRETPALTMSPSQLGLAYIIEQGGAGYFPRRMVRPYIESGQALVANHAPAFQQLVYLVYDSERKDERFNTALQGFRFVAAREAEQ